MLQTTTVAEVMQPLATPAGLVRSQARSNGKTRHPAPTHEDFERLIGPLTAVDRPQALFPDEDLEQALRQLVLFGRDGLPVLSHDGQQLRGWITREDLLQALVTAWLLPTPEIERGALAAESPSTTPEHVSTRRPPRFRAIGSWPRRSLPIRRRAGSASRGSSSPPVGFWLPSATADAWLSLATTCSSGPAIR